MIFQSSKLPPRLQRLQEQRNEQRGEMAVPGGAPPHPAGVRGPPPPWYWHQMGWGGPRPPMPGPPGDGQPFPPRHDSGEDGERRTPDGPPQMMPGFERGMWPTHPNPAWEEAVRRGQAPPPHPYYGYHPDYQPDPRSGRDPDYDPTKG